MTEENRRANIEVELEKGDNSLRAAEALLALALWDDAVSRAYYAAFHHVQALLLSEGLEARSHGGTHDLFYLHFARSRRVDGEIAKRFAGLQKYREQADYARAFRFSEAGARAELDSARAICEAVRRFLRAGGWLPGERP